MSESWPYRPNNPSDDYSSRLDALNSILGGTC